MIVRFIRIIVLLLSFGLTGCSVTKYLPANESLYVGAEVKMLPDSNVSAKTAKTVKSELEPLLRPKPNKLLFGFPLKVWMYYVLGEPKKEKSFRGWFRKRFGEPPVFASKRVATTNSLVIGNYLNNEGYFRSSATGELKEKNRKVKAIYNVTLRKRYTIQKIEFLKQDTGAFFKNFDLTQKNSLLKEGDPYRLIVIETERARIDQELKKQGFYYFRPDYLIIKADTNLNSHQVNLSMQLKPNTTQLALKTYFIQNIFVVTDNGMLSKDTLSGAVLRRGGLRIVDQENAYKPRIFYNSIGFRRGTTYSSELHDVSLSRLINLKNFKFVKNRFDLVPRSDSAMLDVYYYLTPLKKKTMRAEISAVTKSNNLTGSQVGVTWLNRNIFKGAEQLRISGNVGIDVQLGGRRNKYIRDYYRTSAEAELTFPRFVIPFYKIRPEKNQALPKTTFLTGFERLTQQGLYTQTSFKLNWGYSWRKNVEIEHTFLPIALNVIKPSNISEALIDSIFTSSKPQDLFRYLTILENRLILGAQYNITYTPTPKPLSKNSFVITGGFDIAGNVAGLISKGRKEVGLAFGIPYEQYARFDAEIRYYRDINPKLRWANRVLAGIGIPYGNSLSLPQIKQYFAGGTNGIRAFRARSLGPGSARPDTTSIFFNLTFGDIRLEANTELRLRINKYIETAAFVDAGNIWMYRNYDESYYTPEDNAVFTNQFYKQLAIGGGLGIRIVTPFVLVRFDLATPFRKPWLPDNERWVFNKFDFGSKAWRKENLVLNIAVGYSF
ncbi:BamA/TamA family outer membrane protein [Runella sp.]|uniref:translocation and assembly module lipoprotein TamL n=1 Tax=Runella sp. TaxID=1960881 RepID=UPI003D0BB07C